ncbi:MAG: OmpA family protein [Saprospiraceae bacterium]|nr:OmpA family protein [Saprospiraceae bacterium]
MKLVNAFKIFFLFIFFGLFSCVSSKKFKLSKAENESLQSLLTKCKEELGDCLSSKEEVITKYNSKVSEIESGMSSKIDKIKSLEEQLDYLKKNNTNLLERLSDLSVVSKTGAESIQKSLEAMNEKDIYIKNLTSEMSRKDSINLALVMNLKRSLGDISSDDINIEVKKGVVYISLSDKMLFRSGSSVINESAGSTLEKIARILNDQRDLDILIEGHTDNVPINTDCVIDNWDLSTKRATAIARLLQRKYNVEPARITAGGRSEYLPKTGNESETGRKQNRRTEIIILPKLDQFFKLSVPQSK